MAMAKQTYRTERDSMGEMRIPADLLYGASTARALQYSSISAIRVPVEIIHALGMLKACSAEVNRDQRKLDRRLAKAIIEASNAIAEGHYDGHFPLDVFQTGSGTSTNMNFNEVAANIANLSLGEKLGSHQPVHPNDHVNRGQSSNDLFPSSIRVAAVILIEKRCLPVLQRLEGALAEKARLFRNAIKVGRTHLQDATPLTLGQEFSGFATQVQYAQSRLRAALPRLKELPVGGTAVGTGINTLPRFGKLVCDRLNRRLNSDFTEARNHFEAQAAQDACVETSGVLKTIAVSLIKVAGDIRWMATGPRCGLGELVLPALQPGSSIMPGKVNPVVIESLLQVCAQVIGNDLAITWGGASGQFELNTMMPLIGYNLRQSIVCLSGAAENFESNVVRGLKADMRQLALNLEKSLMIVTALVPQIGYDKAATIAKRAFETHRDIRAVAEEMGVPKSDLTKLLDPSKMLGEK